MDVFNGKQDKNTDIEYDFCTVIVISATLEFGRGLSSQMNLFKTFFVKEAVLKMDTRLLQAALFAKI